MNNNNQTNHEENMKDPAERLTYALFGVKVAMLAVHESVHALGYDFGNGRNRGHLANLPPL